MPTSPHRFIDIWKYAAQDSSVAVTPQVLREWFCDEMGRLGVPDRYVDAFCGRFLGRCSRRGTATSHQKN